MSVSPISDVTIAVMPKTVNELLGGPITSRYEDDCPFKNTKNNLFTRGIHQASSFVRGIELPTSAFEINETA